MTLSIDTSRITVDPLPVDLGFGYPSAILRLDKIDPKISGNKFFKLRYYLEEAVTRRKSGLLTFGGAWSNHLVATAAACRQINLACVGVVRGENTGNLSPALADCVRLGMKLEFVSRTQYKNTEELARWAALYYPNMLVVPEGGRGMPGRRGAGEIASVIPGFADYTHLLCAVGTGTMLAGLAEQLQPHQHIIGISSLKGEDSILPEILRETTVTPAQIALYNQFHFGGYARYTKELLDFMNRLYNASGVPTDIVYTGKLCFGWSSLCEQQIFPKNANLLLIHSGGLQGNRSLSADKLAFKTL